MAGVKISNLPAATTPLSGTETVPLVQSGVTSKATVTDIGDAATYTATGTGAVSRLVSSKLGDFVSVKDFGAVGDGVTDDTAAFTAAQNASDFIYIPPGTYVLDQFKQQNAKVFRGGGLNNTFIKQANTARPAWWIVSKAGVYTTQIIGAELSGVWFLGKSGSTVATCIAEAIAPFIIANSKFDFGGSGGYHTFQVITNVAFEFYNNIIRIVQQDPDGRSGGIGSTNTGVVCGTGVYNQWYLRIVGASNGIGFTSNGFNEVFNDPITDCQQVFTGQACTVINPTVEAWAGTAQTGAISNLGYNNRFINITLTNVPNTSVSGYGVVLNAASPTITTILGYKVYGSYGAGTAPLRPIQVGSNNSGFIADAETSGCSQKLEAYCSYDQLKNFTFAGDSTGLTSMAKKFPLEPQFVTAATYTLDANFATTGQPDETIYLNSSANCTITLPSAATCVGRKIYVCSRVAYTLSSASANVLPMSGGATPAILSASVGKWATLQAGANGYWNIIANN